MCVLSSSSSKVQAPDSEGHNYHNTGLAYLPRTLRPPLPSIDGHPAAGPPRVVAQHAAMHTFTLEKLGCATYLFLLLFLPRTVGGAGSCGATFGWGEKVDTDTDGRPDSRIGAGAAPGWMALPLCAEGGIETLNRCARRCSEDLSVTVRVDANGSDHDHALSAQNPFRVPV